MVHTDNKAAVKPFLKWAGGKGQLLKAIRKTYPPELGRGIKKYAEPFVGGGAVLLDILSRYALDGIYISDVNTELINAYKAVRDDVAGLVSALGSIQKEYLRLTPHRRKKYYYAKRELFNASKPRPPEDGDTDAAALFIFLNKTCFNGLHRVNKKGLFNVPIGAYKNPLICDTANLERISALLQNVTIVCGDYRLSSGFIDANTFVYFDPPYRPLNETANFNAYTENIFNDISHRELADFVNEMAEKQAKIVVSNSDPKNADKSDNFFDELYAGHRIGRTEAARTINCNRDARGKINELLISTF